MRFSISRIALIILVAVSNSFAVSEEFKEFNGNYERLDIDLLNNPCEIVEVENYIYEKDLAVFTFEKGTFYFLRYVNDRPTTAIFIGDGNASIKIPSHVERHNLLCIARDSVVNEDFESCFIRFADDLDLKVKSQFDVEQSNLSWKVFNIAKRAQGEVFFKPVIKHRYDNYFQLLRSVYERAEDGYFWIDFNRYVFTFDPNQAEQFRLAYEFEGGDFSVTEAAIMQRREIDIYDDLQMSDIAFPTTCLERLANITMGGADGTHIDEAMSTIKLLVNNDSIKYVSLFLDHDLKEDSIYYLDKPVDYKRRSDFDFIGIILPEYRFKGDTLEFVLWFRGRGFDNALPYVENPEASMLSLEFVVPSNSNYYMPGKGTSKKLEGRFETFSAVPDHPYNTFYFQGYVSGVDTVQVISDVGITLDLLSLSYINKHNFNCFIPERIHQASVVDAFNFMSSKFGSPYAAFRIFVSPENGRSMPGLVFVPQVSCVSEWEAFGGMDLIAGNGVAQQWFGNALRPASDRETWVANALPNFISLLFVENNRDSRAYFSNIFSRRDTLLNIVDRGWDKPLAAGRRVSATLSINKGVWLMHMLRFLMFDTEKQSTKKFLKFLHELSAICNSSTFKNADVVRIAEKHYGGSLDAFFGHWLFGNGVPEFNVEYRIEKRDDAYYVNGSVVTKKVNGDFSMPVIMRVELGGTNTGESRFFREKIDAPETTFELGPFTSEPKKFVFNEFFSVLSEDKVKKK